ncbi:ATP synthase F1 subunit delta [Candidatus Trichorickettsia mobilis]|uniref:ATP synthase F1 subunit delta n=1 Tax=Candidatus Trichorickettsia mobilis TaxID=1346319 RepID=UPI0029302B51|nr:ATP synthase F1 subunit delta [Candidatus Trichorickettsia mobilis]
MDNTRLVKNYAVSLFSSAVTVGAQDKIMIELQAIEKILIANMECKLLLCTPVVSKTQKLRLVNIITQYLLADSMVKRFLAIVVNNARFNLFSDIVLFYYKLLNDSKNIKLAAVTSSGVLQLNIQDQVKNYLESLLQSQLEIKFYFDPEIVGGLVIEYDHYLLDCSIAGALNRIEKITNIIR